MPKRSFSGATGVPLDGEHHTQGGEFTSGDGAGDDNYNQQQIAAAAGDSGMGNVAVEGNHAYGGSQMNRDLGYS